MADNYTITSQKQNVQLNPGGTGFIDVWDIGYRVTGGPSKGTTGTVSVPDEDHNADYVKNAIEEKINSLDSIANL
jgi:hypothetical protein